MSKSVPLTTFKVYDNSKNTMLIYAFTVFPWTLSCWPSLSESTVIEPGEIVPPANLINHHLLLQSLLLTTTILLTSYTWPRSTVHQLRPAPGVTGTVSEQVVSWSPSTERWGPYFQYVLLWRLVFPYAKLPELSKKFECIRHEARNCREARNCASLSTPWLFNTQTIEPAKHPDNRADYCLGTIWN